MVQQKVLPRYRILFFLYPDWGRDMDDFIWGV